MNHDTSGTSQRVVSLLASATEIICALGCADRMVGISHECDFPPEVVAKLPRITQPKFPCDGTSYDIDQKIRAILAEGLTVYRVCPEKLRSLRPEIIVTQLQCEVCAVSPKEVEEALRDWTRSRPSIVALSPDSLAGVYADIIAVASALSVEQAGDQLVAAMKFQMKQIEQVAQTASALPRVACIEWLEPLMSAGNWMPELVSFAGAQNLFGEAGVHSPWLLPEELVASNPDYILILPCGFGIDRALQEVHILESFPGWGTLRAVNNGRVFVLDGNQYFNRPGPRIVQSLEILAEIFHPELFCFGHEGEGWRRLACISPKLC